MVEGFGDTYTDDLPITTEPPFEYTEMSDIQRTMLEAYFKDKASDFKEAKISASPTAVELMSYMRTRYGISNEYSAEQMRKIAGLRYSINVRYAVNTGEYVFVQDASMKLISSIMENKLNGIEVKRSFTRQYHTENAAHILGYVGLMTTEEYEKYSLLNYANDAMVGKDGAENAFEKYLHGKDGEVEASVFDRYRDPLYKEASFKPYIIAAMIFLAKVKDPVAKLKELEENAKKRQNVD